ncbi:MAG: hypothetical protein QNJ13_00680 [Paracoccaceae bacterium]|nr:hypothetical protein [Paracoccaceae bacterium]
MRSIVSLEFVGRFDPQSFAAFAAHRAERLSLDHLVVSGAQERTVIRLEGPDPLIDAFEMALSLGPADCLVRDVRRLENGAQS